MVFRAGDMLVTVTLALQSSVWMAGRAWQVHPQVASNDPSLLVGAPTCNPLPSHVAGS